MLISPFAARARRRRRLRSLRDRAPKHPPGPEANLRHAVARVFAAYHAHLRETIVRMAPVFVHQRRHDHQLNLPNQPVDSTKSTARRDANDDDDEPLPVEPKPTDKSLLLSVFVIAWQHAQELLHGGPFRQALDAAGNRTAKSAADQTRSALRLGDDYQPDLTSHVDVLSAQLIAKSESLMADSLTRAEDVLDEWGDLPEDSEDYEDEGALDGMLDDGLSGITGSALASVALSFAGAFGDMIRGAQEEAGVETYMWVTMTDSRVRPAHAALDGSVNAWDDPPLSAEDADSGEPCHPGDDFNCRCVASPYEPEDLN